MEENKQFIYKYRSSMDNTKRALKRGGLTIGFIGGSITDGRDRDKWPEAVSRWFAETYPQVQIHTENCAIGATRSDLAVFRAKRDLIDRGCDLVFVEYAVNDYDVERVRRARQREGLLRKLLSAGTMDVVCVYTFVQEMFEDMMSGKIPETIEDFELLCDHYGLNSVWMGRYALDEICKGRMRWEEWLPDGLHPSERGSLSYAQSVIMFLEKALSEQEGDTDRKSMPAEPLDPLNWENTEIIPFEEMTLSGSWIIQRSLKSVFIDRLLSTSVPGAKVCLEFEGRGAVIGLDFGKRGADLRCFVDGEEKKIIPIEKAEWMPENGWFTLRIIDDCLEYGRHFLEIETVNVSKVFCSGTNCDIAFVGIIK